MVFTVTFPSISCYFSIHCARHEMKIDKGKTFPSAKISQSKFVFYVNKMLPTNFKEKEFLREKREPDDNKHFIY